MRVPTNSTGKVGPMNPNQFRKVAASANKVAQIELASDQAGVASSFVAKIKASPVSIGTNRWRYQWEEVIVVDDNSVVTAGVARKNSGLTGMEFTWALNLCEMCQSISSPTKVGPGVTISTIPAGFSVQPISEGTCVVMHAMKRRSGKPIFCFSMPNAIDGTCTAFTGGGGGGGAIE